MTTARRSAGGFFMKSVVSKVEAAGLARRPARLGARDSIL